MEIPAKTQPVAPTAIHPLSGMVQAAFDHDPDIIFAKHSVLKLARIGIERVNVSWRKYQTASQVPGNNLPAPRNPR